MPSRRRLALALPLLPWAAAAPAAACPGKTVRIIVPGSPASALDQYARRLAAPMGAALGRTVVVDNRGGGNGILGAESAARAPADGCALLLAGPNVLSINPVLVPTLPYEPLRDFVPITLLVRGTPLLLVGPHVAARTLAELVALGRSRSEPLRCGSPGVGTVPYLALRQIEAKLALPLTCAHYAAPPQVLTDLAGGHLDLAVEFPSAAIGLVATGRLRALAVLGPRRYPALPELPTAAEQGVHGIEAASWLALLAPVGTPADALARTGQAAHAALRLPDFAAWVRTNGSEVATGSAQELAALIRSERARWSQLVQELAITAE